MRWPRPIVQAFEAAHPSRRRAWLALALLVALIVAAGVSVRLHDANARLHEEVVRNRLVLGIAQARAAENQTLARVSVPARNGDARSAIDRVLTGNGLRFTTLDAQDGDATQRIVIDVAPFDVLIHALDTLQRQEGLRLTDATVAARVDPGTVRAELAFTR